MPPPSPDNDLKCRARRRLVGAVALLLGAIVVLPFLLEDTPPPGSELAITLQKTVPVALPPANPAESPTVASADASAAQSESDIPAPPPLVSEPPPAQTEPTPTAPLAAPAPPAVEPQPARSEPARPEAAKPESFRPESTRPAPVKPPVAASTNVATARPATPSATPVEPGFVVQLAALADARRASQLKAQATLSGFSVYTDRAGELTRVRVGPFTSREDAVAAAIRLAESGLPGQVLSK